MDIKKLKAFSVVGDFGSFSRAAGMLGMAQPVLSRQVRSLEEELGVQLVHRNGRGIALTEAGVLLNEYAKGILATLARAQSEVSALRASPRGNVVIGMPPSMGSVLTVPLIQRFRSEYPSINMRVIEGFSGYLLEWLTTGKIPQAKNGSASRVWPTNYDFSQVRVSRLQIVLNVPASKFAHPPDRPYRCEYCRRAAGAFTSGPIVLCYLRTHRIC